MFHIQLKFITHLKPIQIVNYIPSMLCNSKSCRTLSIIQHVNSMIKTAKRRLCFRCRKTGCLQHISPHNQSSNKLLFNLWLHHMIRHIFINFSRPHWSGINSKNQHWWDILYWLQLFIICDMIKRNESDVGYVVFEILAKTVFKFLCFILFLELSNPS